MSNPNIEPLTQDFVIEALRSRVTLWDRDQPIEMDTEDFVSSRESV